MQFDLANPDRRVNVGIILTGGITEILDVAPIDLVHGLSPSVVKGLPVLSSFEHQAIDIAVYWVTENGRPAKLTSGITMQATVSGVQVSEANVTDQTQHSFANCPPLDVVLMGAHMPDYQANDAELAFIRKSYDQCSAFLAICMGMENLLRAGLLEGKTATAPRFLLEHLRKDASGTKWVEKRWAHDGKVWTSGTLLCGLDMMRAFILETWHDSRPELVEATLDLSCCPVREAEY
ncbi:hypothetical protein ANO11243_080420 [Dothideomycetidae sp. 11243]|nr:hypothetical protein ANO11243_080420 [fungal sp. No.11243]